MKIQIPNQNSLTLTPVLDPNGKPVQNYIQPREVLPNGKVVITLGSSQINDFLTCNRMFHLRHEELLELNGLLRENSPLDLGTFGHSLLEEHYRKGSDLLGEEIVLIASKFQRNPLFSLTAQGYKQVQEAYNHYCFNEKLGVIKRISPISKESIEIGFSKILKDTTEYVFILTGRIDLLGIEDSSNTISVVDHKFQMRANNLYQKGIQFRTYSYAAGVSQLIVNYVRLTKIPAFERVRILFSQLDHELWEQELIKIFEDFLHSTKDNPNYASCAGKYGFPCQYSTICDHLEPLDSPFVERIKESMYHQIEGHVSWDLKKEE